MDGIDDAVVDVVLEDDPAHAGNGRVDGRQLDQDVAAVAAVFDHALDGFDVARNARQPVEDAFRFRMVMVMMGTGVCLSRLFFFIVIDEIGFVGGLDDLDEIEPVRIHGHDDGKAGADQLLFQNIHRRQHGRAAMDGVA